MCDLHVQIPMGTFIPLLPANPPKGSAVTCRFPGSEGRRADAGEEGGWLSCDAPSVRPSHR